MALYTQARRRGQMLSNRRRNVTGGVAGPKPPVPGQGPPIIPGGQPADPPSIPGRPHGVNAQGYSPIRYGANNQKWGYAKVGQARNQGVPQPTNGGALQGLAGQLAAGNLPDRFEGGRFALTPNGKIVDQGYGVYTPEQARQYQLLYNAAQKAGVNIVGQSGEGGGYNPTVLYAQPNRYVDMRTGLANPPSTGASATAGSMVSPEVLARLREKSGYDAANVNTTAMAVGENKAGEQSQWQLGSDGQYHDINSPLPPGVELKPPEGATAPQTQDPSMIAEAAHGTPQAAINAGKDPTKHLAYWEDKGWTYNPATDAWTNRNGGAPVSTPTEAPAQAGAAAATMPLDPAYIAAQRAAQLQLNSTLQGTYPALEQIDAQNQLALARMQTNQGYDTQALMEALSARGALQSSIYGTERGNLATNYLRTGQDLAADVANAQSSVYQQQQTAYNDYYAALIEALLASANSSATSEYTPVGNVGGGGNTTNRGNYATPMAARRAGQNPLQKKSYWKSKGWVYKNGKWVKKGGS